MGNDQSLVVLATFPSQDIAGPIARELVDKKLAACVNLLPRIQSIYRWKNAVESETEILAIIKTTREAFTDLENTLKDLHPYEVPEIIALEITAGSRDYIDWLVSSCK